jgi:hypothetical protein
MFARLGGECEVDSVDVAAAGGPEELHVHADRAAPGRDRRRSSDAPTAVAAMLNTWVVNDSHDSQVRSSTPKTLEVTHRYTSGAVRGALARDTRP